MKTHAIFTGSELLSGQTLNSNLITLGMKWNEMGWRLESSSTIPDETQLIKKTLLTAMENHELVIICGGLGATSDDITRRAVADALKLKINYSEKIRTELEEFMAQRQRTPQEQWLKNQSEHIESAKLLNNSTGLAYGQIIKYGSKLIALLPGPPSEFSPMLNDELVALINSKKSFTQLNYIIAGETESSVERRCSPIKEEYPQIDFGFCAQPGLVKLSLRIPQNIEVQEVEKLCKSNFKQEILNKPSLAEEILHLARSKKWTFASAESCTGGLVSSALTAIPGSSDVVSGAIVSYSCDWKNLHLKVKKSLLKKFGAVSHECAYAMAEGLRNKYKVDCGIAITGIAGPDGGSEEKQVGLVYIASFTPTAIKVEKCVFRGDRNMIRQHSVSHSLNQLRLQIKQK
ncbi:nicotinamide-nucleotide amidohydrolase family protein [Lentisphaera profundi]|uniref:CinA-like protein n=1 Tax=Lentisphaera profundi TaxID=1658616 RepID=A0ABY7VS71_9BACT|nr:nicotinamide-nucleotide amidohydrolase family protein [Lentisphaera profundi]WDE96149.1 nicotinamide-nucleotide amidohydrolase family protein [Lentisphaera profundi]